MLTRGQVHDSKAAVDILSEIDISGSKTVSSNEKRGYDGGKKRKEEKDT